ncbi:M60 family metallopeptidase [Elizabethkingia anophelis]|uniref:M60 family metallopeptidase n=1 Tax=Elizabethkingia anophelis TaxID=1117645 RepID=UPI003892A279
MNQLRPINLFFLTILFTLWGCYRDDISQKNYKPTNLSAETATNNIVTTQIGQNVQTFIEKKMPSLEKKRIGVNWYWTDFEPTGLYLPANTSITIDVVQVSGISLPKLLIGTYSLRTDGPNNSLPREIQLTSGTNIIPGDTKGGILWIRYNNSYSSGASSVKITFKTGHQKMPIYIKNNTTSQDWYNQLQTYSYSPDVLVIGDHIYQVYNKNLALKNYNDQQDINYALNIADSIWNTENELSGLDGSSPTNLPHEYNKCLMSEEIMTWAGGYAYNYVTAYYPGFASYAFSLNNGIGTYNGAYVVAHEMGHLHQQSAITWSTLSEVTNEVFTNYVLKRFNSSSSILAKPTLWRSESVWPYVKMYLDNNNINKDFNGDIGQYTSKPDYTNHIKVAMFLQLQMAFGDNFIIELNKRSRTEGAYLNEYSSDADKMRFFMLTSCKISGKNLTNFFKKWGFKVSTSVYNEIAILNLPAPSIDPTTLSE